MSIVQEIALADQRVKFTETKDNGFKKAGALNIAYRLLGDELNRYDFILSMDGDTFLSPDVAEQGLEEFLLDESLGAVCSRAGVIEMKTDSFFEKLLYYQQRVEYAEFDRSRISQHKRIKVAHGMCTMYKVAAIKAVMKKRIEQGKLDCLPYDVHNITEDYELTVCIKECGFNVAVGLGMLAWTDIPLRIKDLWTQRIRWLRGGLDTLHQHGWNEATRKDILNAGFFWVMLIFQGILLGYAVKSLIEGVFYLNNTVLLVMALMYVDCVYTLRYVRGLCKWDCAVRMTFLPQLLYAWLTIFEQLYAYYLFLFKKDQRW